jgi:hypothetical protein
MTFHITASQLTFIWSKLPIVRVLDCTIAPAVHWCTMCCNTMLLGLLLASQVKGLQSFRTHPLSTSSLAIPKKPSKSSVGCEFKYSYGAYSLVELPRRHDALHMGPRRNMTYTYGGVIAQTIHSFLSMPIVRHVLHALTVLCGDHTTYS